MHNDKFQIIRRRDFMVDINNQKVITPEFTMEGTSSFRMTSDLILQKQCYTCKKWYNVAKYEDGEWVEIWKESEYKKSDRTGTFGSYCSDCIKIKNDKKKKQIPKLTTSTSYTNGSAQQKKDTVIWSENIYKYIMIKAVLENKSKNEYLNSVIEEYMLKNPISLENKI